MRLSTAENEKTVRKQNAAVVAYMYSVLLVLGNRQGKQEELFVISHFVSGACVNEIFINYIFDF